MSDSDRDLDFSDKGIIVTLVIAAAGLAADGISKIKEAKRRKAAMKAAIDENNGKKED